MNEIWKKILYFEGKYEVSNLGNIRNSNTKKILKGYICKTNLYKAVKINHKNYQLHRLIAQTFIPNPNNYPIINHKDGNKLNNRVDNLEWCTYKYNSQEAQRIGLYDKRNINLSINPLRSKKIKMYLLNGEYVKSFNDSVEAVKELKQQNPNIKINSRNIRKVCNKERKTAGGYRWEYVN